MSPPSATKCRCQSRCFILWVEWLENRKIEKRGNPWILSKFLLVMVLLLFSVKFNLSSNLCLSSPPISNTTLLKCAHMLQKHFVRLFETGLSFFFLIILMSWKKNSEMTGCSSIGVKSQWDASYLLQPQWWLLHLHTIPGKSCCSHIFCIVHAACIFSFVA